MSLLVDTDFEGAAAVDQTESARSCLDLIARHAPRMMRLGGGAIKKELRGRITPEEEAAICAAYAETLSVAKCAERSQRSWNACRVILKRNGIVLADHSVSSGIASARKPETQRALDEYFATHPAFGDVTISAIALRHGVDKSRLCALVKKEKKRRAAA